MIEAEGLVKRIGEVCALNDVSFSVERGTVLGLLGPNGAGKSTIVRILTTLLKPDAGAARVGGFVAVIDGQRLRSITGLAGQYVAVDELLSGRENLELVGLQNHLPRREYRRRAAEALERMSLTGAWAVLATIAHNLIRWVGSLGLELHGPLVAKTIRRRFLTIPGRLTRSARQRRLLHLPTNWPWATEWTACFGRLCALRI